MVSAAPNRCVLVVEDDPDVASAVRDALEAEGYDVQTATDGAAALDVLGSGLRPALILLDLSMPRMDGWTFCEVRNRDLALLSIPVILMSASAGPTRVAPYVGVAAVLAKPLDPARMLDAVKRFAKTHPTSPGVPRGRD